MLLRNALFILNDGLQGCQRPEEKKPAKRATTKKCGSPLTEPLNWENRPGSGLPPFLFPILEYIIHCHIQSRFQALLQDRQNLCL